MPSPERNAAYFNRLRKVNICQPTGRYCNDDNGLPVWILFPIVRNVDSWSRTSGAFDNQAAILEVVGIPKSIPFEGQQHPPLSDGSKEGLVLILPSLSVTITQRTTKNIPQ